MISMGVIAQAVRASSGVLWTPLNMTAIPQLYLDANDSTVTEVSGFVSEVSNLGSMGAAGNFSQDESANRPSMSNNAVGGKRALIFDGVNDSLRGGSASQRQLFQNVSGAWCFCLVRKRNLDTDASRLVFSASIGNGVSIRFRSNVGSVAAAGGPNRLSVGAVRIDGESVNNNTLSPLTVGAYTMVMMEVDYSTGVGRIHTNGSLSITNPSAVTVGQTSNTPSQEPLAIGAFPNIAANGGFGDIDLAAILVSNVNTPSPDIDKLFGWAAHKWGLTASLPAGHPYKTSPPMV